MGRMFVATLGVLVASLVAASGQDPEGATGGTGDRGLDGERYLTDYRARSLFGTGTPVYGGREVWRCPREGCDQRLMIVSPPDEPGTELFVCPRCEGYWIRRTDDNHGFNPFVGPLTPGGSEQDRRAEQMKIALSQFISELNATDIARRESASESLQAFGNFFHEELVRLRTDPERPQVARDHAQIILQILGMRGTVAASDTDASVDEEAQRFWLYVKRYAEDPQNDPGEKITRLEAFKKSYPTSLEKFLADDLIVTVKRQKDDWVKGRYEAEKALFEQNLLSYVETGEPVYFDRAKAIGDAFIDRFPGTTFSADFENGLAHLEKVRAEHEADADSGGREPGGEN